MTQLVIKNLALGCKVRHLRSKIEGFITHMGIDPEGPHHLVEYVDGEGCLNTMWVRIREIQMIENPDGSTVGS